MSLSRVVSPEVPSLFHSSAPLPSLAENTRLPLRLTSDVGADPAGPGLMSFTRTVPCGVPSVFHSSTPLMPSSAAKYTAPFTSHRLAGLDDWLYGRRSATSSAARRVRPSNRSA